MTSNMEIPKTALISIFVGTILILVNLAFGNETFLGKHRIPVNSTPQRPNPSTASFPSSHAIYQTILRKLNLPTDSHEIAQLSHNGSLGMHKLVTKLRKVKLPDGTVALNSSLSSDSIKPVSMRLLGVNKIASGIPTFITNNVRLKRQLEGIFHVRPSPTPTQKALNVTPTTATLSPTHRGSWFNNRGSVIKRIRNNGVARAEDKNNTTLAVISNNDKSEKKSYNNANQFKSNKENAQITTITNFQPKKKPNINKKMGDDASKGKRNFTVEIVEIARKTVITEDNKKSGKYVPTLKPTQFAVVTSHTTTKKPTITLLQSVPVTIHNSPTGGGTNLKQRLRLKPFGNPKNKNPIVSTLIKDSPTAATQPGKYVPSVKYRPATTDQTPSATAAYPIPISSTVFPPNPLRAQQRLNHVQVKVTSFNEQIPHNEVDENDLKDFLVGHEIFGAKGNFKHSVPTQSTPIVLKRPTPTKPQQWIPIASPTATTIQPRPPVIPQQRYEPPREPQKRTRVSSPPISNSHEIEMEKAMIKNQRQNNNKATVYTATGVPIPEEERNKDPPVFEYSGKKDGPNQFPKLSKSTLDELYRQGHPAVAKAPGSVYESHPLGEPYGQNGLVLAEDDYNPFKANPLVDDVPLKFDPESDRYYGNPTPDKVAQSNKPEPVQISQQEKSDRVGEPEYQEEERSTSTSSPQPRERVDREQDYEGPTTTEHDTDVFYKRAYPPPEENDDERSSDAPEDETDAFIRDFVSLDNNFQTLPRPSRDEEQFRGLLPEEREDDDHLFERDDRRNRRDRDNDRDDDRSKEDQRENEEGDEDDAPPDDYEDVEGNFGPAAEDFDQAYMNALKTFDDEIKKIQENERNGITTESGNPTSSHEPLVITSPGPTVSYQQRNAPSPSQSTTPANEDEQEEEEEQEEERHPSRGSDEDDRREGQEGNTTNREDEEEEVPPSRENDETVKDESVKIKKVMEVKSDGNQRGDGDLDDDISLIEEEFSRRGTL